MPAQKILQYLKDNSIQFIPHEHEAVFTCEAADRINIPGIQAKTLILRDSKDHKFYMVIMPGKKRLDLKSLRTLLNAKKLSFASPEYLENLLQVTPGSCSPFGLIFDKDQKLQVFLDQDVADSPIVNFHPNINTSSLELTQEEFQKFLNSIPHQIQAINIESQN